MLRKGPHSSSRQVVWVEGQSVKGWGCSECAWVFHPSGPPTGESLDEMKRNFQTRKSQERKLLNNSNHMGIEPATSSLGSSGNAWLHAESSTWSGSGRAECGLSGTG